MSRWLALSEPQFPSAEASWWSWKDEMSSLENCSMAWHTCVGSSCPHASSSFFFWWPWVPEGVPSREPCLLPPQCSSVRALCRPRPTVPPRITLPPSLPGPVLLHSPVRLSCNATGVPSPMLMWLKDGNPVSTAGTTGLQVSRALWCLRRCWEEQSGPGSDEGTVQDGWLGASKLLNGV